MPLASDVLCGAGGWIANIRPLESIHGRLSSPPWFRAHAGYGPAALWLPNLDKALTTGESGLMSDGTVAVLLALDLGPGSP
jgi:hypothetical protein